MEKDQELLKLTDKKKPLTKAEIEAKMAASKPYKPPPTKKEKEDLASKPKDKPN
jgi:hypothetical protein